MQVVVQDTESPLRAHWSDDGTTSLCGLTEMRPGEKEDTTLAKMCAQCDAKVRERIRE